MGSYEDELCNEALRVYARYATELVERFDLCPWARRARLDGHTSERVILGRNPQDFGTSLATIEALNDEPHTEVALLIYPELELGRLPFEVFVRELRARDGARYEFGKSPYAMAAFHPDAPADLSDPERLIPFLRRTPDPTIQLVRQDALERVRGRFPQGTAFVDPELLSPQSLAQEEPMPTRERIARANQKTVLENGVESLDLLFDAIRRDRTEAYLRIGERHQRTKPERA